MTASEGDEMARGGRKKKALETGAGQGVPRRAFANRPFAKLEAARAVEPAPPAKQPAPPKPSSAPAEPLGDDEALAELMRGVRPLDAGPPLREQRVAPRPMLAEADDDALVMRKLDELVHGEVPFDFADTEEYIEAHVAGLDRRIVSRLKAGDFAVQRHLDLHGMGREEARTRVADFLRRAQRQSLRCVLIVHGRGKGSPDNVPILKEKLRCWLTRGAIGRRVLAYASARPFDGGTGAVYVLLRR
jgi:DNA-nicking Smr family endonuclease